MIARLLPCLASGFNIIRVYSLFKRKKCRGNTSTWKFSVNHVRIENYWVKNVNLALKNL